MYKDEYEGFAVGFGDSISCKEIDLGLMSEED